MNLNIFQSPTDTAYALLHSIIKKITDEPEKIFHIAFSGGGTPLLMYDLWAHDLADITPWDRIRFWWVDERCVAPTSPDSNYGQMEQTLLKAVPVSPYYVYRICGECDPAREAARYSLQVMEHVPVKNKMPVFDWVLLGVGEDGHTSSIFPGQETLLSTSAIYEESVQPHSGQRRIALTGVPIINARQVVFLITGKNKAAVVKNIYSSDETIPAGYIANRAQQVELYLDEAAAADIER